MAAHMKSVHRISMTDPKWWKGVDVFGEFLDLWFFYYFLLLLQLFFLLFFFTV